MSLKQAKPLIIIAGPTASGKSAIAIELAKILDGEIISADSMQVYRGLDIGTAKISPSEMEGIKHHLLDICPPEATYNVAQFAQDGQDAYVQIRSRNKWPIIAGGTGLYINALLYPNSYQDIAPPNPAFREQKAAEAGLHGAQYLHQQLAKLDSQAAAKIHANDLKRVIRALEIIDYCGRPLSQVQAQGNKQPAYQTLIYGLSWPRDILYQRIEDRIEQMLSLGFAEEVKSLLSVGLSPKATSMQGLGYRHLAAYWQGYCNYKQAVEHLKRDTRRFAKRQITWFKANQNLKWFNFEDYNLGAEPEDIADLTADIIKNIKNSPCN